MKLKRNQQTRADFEQEAKMAMAVKLFAMKRSRPT